LAAIFPASPGSSGKKVAQKRKEIFGPIKIEKAVARPQTNDLVWNDDVRLNQKPHEKWHVAFGVNNEAHAEIVEHFVDDGFGLVKKFKDDRRTGLRVFPVDSLQLHRQPSVASREAFALFLQKGTDSAKNLVARQMELTEFARKLKIRYGLHDL
jgi:hypothetical protein